ncbi:MAG: hypothetical protein LC641_00400 [Spirochaeta sp.]|nr:hypothetical protein [Spirochaeta sp.]
MKNMRIIMALTIIVSLPITTWAAGTPEQAGQDEQFDQWMQDAQVGPYQPEQEDWDMILNAAQQEPPATIYSNTSRAFDPIDEFNEMYGLEVEVLNISTSEILERLQREYDAEVFEADVVLGGATPQYYTQLMVERDAVVHYAPRDLEARLSERDMTPTLIHRWSVGTWYYSSGDPDDDTVPYENIWELTTEEWNNRVVWRSPLDSSTVADIMVGFVTNPDLMEELYEDYFGEPIELTTENAGYEWILRMLENSARVVPSHTDVAEAITAAQNRGEKMVGMGTQSVYRNVVDGDYDFFLDTQVAPTVTSSRPISMVSYSDSPNQAKLIIRYLTSQEGGTPWWGADFPVDPEVVASGPLADLKLSDFNILIDTDLQEAVGVTDAVIDFWQLNE